MEYKPKVAILYIATGRYQIFWEYFYRSAEKFLLEDCDKQYFIFTDSEHIFGSDKYSNINVIQQNKLGWPLDTLMRFNIFLTIKDKLSQFDYIFFFNANTEILKPIYRKDILPVNSENLVLAIQPHMFHKNKNNYTYDRNANSLAYIPYGSGQFYVTGALNGGKAKDYLNMCETLNERIKRDLAHDVIALWHDESHLNCYIIGRDDLKILSPYFTRGELEYWKTSSKLMFSDKTHFRFGGHDYLRGQSDEKISKLEWENLNGRVKKKYAFRLKQYFKSLFL